MTRRQRNAIYGWCWLVGMAIGYAVAGPMAALVIFFLPVALIGCCFAVLGKLRIDWDHRRGVKRTSDDNSGQPGSSG
ncbi:hypothetical protein Pan44_09460 [Caulifigura coniformis]|uniref:Uncharacterized protein n=1 Tax=Caulifigura coniformis TaxID=2527983 RepID=A0A517S9Y7_9PLAN|nr:hypothetical protein [Caulifigura coniformis]QDT52933.1 hypothetical protein Pan44_09460 [Caulifigura coniformis]